MKNSTPHQPPAYYSKPAGYVKSAGCPRRFRIVHPVKVSVYRSRPFHSIAVVPLVQRVIVMGDINGRSMCLVNSCVKVENTPAMAVEEFKAHLPRHRRFFSAVCDRQGVLLIHVI